jgi:ABC-type multidrug transport system permease subunit
MNDYVYFASTYGSCSYGSGSYDNATCATGTASNGSNGGVLTNTGFDILLGVTIACAIIFVALVVRFWRRKPKAAPPAASE